MAASVVRPKQRRNWGRLSALLLIYYASSSPAGAKNSTKIDQYSAHNKNYQTLISESPYAGDEPPGEAVPELWGSLCGRRSAGGDGGSPQGQGKSGKGLLELKKYSNLPIHLFQSFVFRFLRT